MTAPDGSLSAADCQWLAGVTAESIGWLPLGEGTYLHLGKPDEEAVVITVVGVSDMPMLGMF